MEFKTIRLKRKFKKTILALGSHAKNTVCLIKRDIVYLSQGHLDLSNPLGLSRFDRIVKYFLKERPKVIAYDLHPEYQSTKYAVSLAPRYRIFATQHHHAHIASCMAENGMPNQQVIGVAFDGTGLGTNNEIWGAEFLICDYKCFQRVAHLKEIPLLGAEAAIRQPWRVAAWYLYSAYKDRFLNLDISFVKKINKVKWRVLKNMYLSNFNSPLASSMGRLFDGVSALVLGKLEANFEAELPVELEKLAGEFKPGHLGSKKAPLSYSFKIRHNKGAYIIDAVPIFKDIVNELKARAPKEEIAYRFNFTVSEMINRMCLVLRKKYRLKKVVLSGGVFQNALLLRLSRDLLFKNGFKVYSHIQLSAGDSGISLGEAFIANYSMDQRFFTTTT